ncbi:MAG TPA: response regulator [Acidobacteriaceae bacterium]|nr:response regulator [Acidobacteriaceae bacterium]
MSVLTILCIDDEELGLEIRKMVLEREGYLVLTAQDGAGGLSIFESQRVDAVILDYAMPGLDGGQVAAIMRQRKPEIPILMLTAYVTLPDSVMRLVDISATKGDGALGLIDRLREMLAARSKAS